jgi:WD40-like Beta Propeller Repeat
VLEVMNADGSNAHQLGNAVAGDEPAWSPDGSQIVFRADSGLSIIGADGNGLRQLTSGPDEHPSWSPDGQTILFASGRNDPYASSGIFNDTESLELYLVDPGGKNLRPLSFTQPSAWVNTVTVHSSGGKAVSTLPGVPALPDRLTAGTSAALAGNVAAVSGLLASGVDQITLFDARSGAQLAVVQVGAGGDNYVSLVGGDAHWVVFRLGTTISALNVDNRRIVHVGRIPTRAVGLSVSGRRIAWAESSNGRGRIRALELPS